MKKLMALLAVFMFAASVHARPYKLNCSPGLRECSADHCVTIVFKNSLGIPADIKGSIKANLTGAARHLSDGNFEFREKIEAAPDQTSCSVPTKSFWKNVDSASLDLSSNGKKCSFFMPKGVGGKNKFSVALQETGCVITKN